ALLGHRDRHVLLGLDRTCPEMRGNNHVVESEERRLERRFGLEDIERRTSNLATPDSVTERRLIDDPAAGTVDDPHPVFHRRDAFRVDDMFCLLDQRGVHRNHVGNGEELFEGHHPYAELGGTLLGDERVVGDALHVHRVCPLCNFEPDPAETDDPERLLVELHAHELRALPLLLFQARIGLGDVPGEREHHRHRVLGRRKGVSLGCVCHDDPLPGGRVHVHVVHADPGTPDKPEPFPRRNHLCSDLGAAPHDQGIILADNPAEFVLLEIGLDVYSAGLPEDRQPFFRQRIADEHSRVCHKNPYNICAIPNQDYSWFRYKDRRGHPRIGSRKMIILKQGGGEIISGASMKDVPNILWLEEIRKEDIVSVGGKGASLGEMASIGLPVPPAFVVTAQAFRRFLVETGLDQKIYKVSENIDVENNAALGKAADTIKGLVIKAKMPVSIKDDIKASYKKMAQKDLIVAVRSSATAEDLPDASFAGQQETYLNIKGEAALLSAVQDCWASLYGARAIYYRAKQGFEEHTVNIAVVVQQLVHSEKAGVMFTSHPISGEPLTIIEGSWGLGEAVVSGSVSPDHYVFDQRTESVGETTIANKKVEIIPDGSHGTKMVPVDPARQDAQVLSEGEIAKLAMYGKIAENHYGVPQDVEWGIVAGTIYILQSRPITTIGKKEGTGMSGQSKDAKILLKGQGAAPGTATGKVVIIRDVKDTGAVKEGDILVTRMTNPDMVPAMRKVAAIVTDEGGMTCHAAIVSRELGTPAVVGTKTATQQLK